MTDNAPYPDNQAVFNKVATHLLTQNQRATEPLSGSCCYRTVSRGNVLRCAVGCLIPDSVYNTVAPHRDEAYGAIIEGKDLRYACVREALQLSGVPSEALGLLEALQAIHDVVGTCKWRTALSGLAEAHGLQMPEEAKC